MKKIITRLGFSKKTTIVTVVVAALVIAAGYFFVVSQNSNKYQFVSVTSGSITQVVSVTGNTTPIQSLDLSFQSGGTIAAVYKNAGDTVNAGDMLVALDTSSLRAQLAQAQASVAAAQANLQQLQAGPTPQAIQVAQTAVTAAQQSLRTPTPGPRTPYRTHMRKRPMPCEIRSAPSIITPTRAIRNSHSRSAIPGIMNNADTESNQVAQELSGWQAEINGAFFDHHAAIHLDPHPSTTECRPIIFLSFPPC